jgi:hypothetical protein
MDSFAIARSAKSEVELDSCHCVGSIVIFYQIKILGCFFLASGPSEWIDVDWLLIEARKSESVETQVCEFACRGKGEAVGQKDGGRWW